MKKIQVGCNTLIIKNNQLLLGKRKNCFGEGSWGLPGGHLELGESLLEGAKRELKEELGIEAKNLKLISVVEGTKDVDHYIQINFLLENFEGEVTLMEPERCEVLAYFDLNNLPNNIFFPHQKILQAYLENKFYLE